MLARGQFLTGGEKLECITAGGTADPKDILGVDGTDYWALPEIRGTAIETFASLNKVKRCSRGVRELGPMRPLYKVLRQRQSSSADRRGSRRVSREALGH